MASLGAGVVRPCCGRLVHGHHHQAAPSVGAGRRQHVAGGVRAPQHPAHLAESRRSRSRSSRGAAAVRASAAQPDASALSWQANPDYTAPARPPRLVPSSTLARLWNVSTTIHHRRGVLYATEPRAQSATGACAVRCTLVAKPGHECPCAFVHNSPAPATHVPRRGWGGGRGDRGAGPGGPSKGGGEAWYTSGSNPSPQQARCTTNMKCITSAHCRLGASHAACLHDVQGC